VWSGSKLPSYDFQLALISNALLLYGKKSCANQESQNFFQGSLLFCFVLSWRLEARATSTAGWWTWLKKSWFE
jgi:hypothetical protein